MIFLTLHITLSVPTHRSIRGLTWKWGASRLFQYNTVYNVHIPTCIGLCVILSMLWQCKPTNNVFSPWIFSAVIVLFSQQMTVFVYSVNRPCLSHCKHCMKQKPKLCKTELERSTWIVFEIDNSLDVLHIYFNIYFTHIMINYISFFRLV